MAPASELPHIDLSVLTERQRDVIEMHYCSGLSFFAIGEFLCIKKSTVQEHHDRAISKLLDAIEKSKKQPLSRLLFGLGMAMTVALF